MNTTKAHPYSAELFARKGWNTWNLCFALLRGNMEGIDRNKEADVASALYDVLQEADFKTVLKLVNAMEAVQPES